MKKMFQAITATALALTMILTPAFAAGEASSGKPTVAEKQAEIEKKYDIRVTYKTDADGKPLITLNSLITLDTALDSVTPAFVRQISQYYSKKNGSRINFSFVQNSRALSSRESLLAGFDNKSSLIELYVPSSTGSTILTGEDPISIVHELGHAFHLMYTDQYGESKMEKQWLSYNGGEEYSASNIVENPNSKVFFTGYAATSYHEDVAETFAHTFIRNLDGQGISKQIRSGGDVTGLGKKVAYVEKMISELAANPDDALANYRKSYTAKSSKVYQNMSFSGDYLQYIGYPQPRYVLKGTLNFLDKTMEEAIWIKSIGGWYVKETSGAEVIIFPGGVWCEVGKNFQAPKAAA